MSRWKEQFDQHPIHATLDEMRELCRMAPDEPDDQNIIERRRLEKVIDTYVDSLKMVDPELVPFNQLDGLNNALKHPNVWNHVNNYKSSLNTAHLVAINDQLSVQLTQLALLLAIAKRSKSVKPIEGVEKLFDEFVSTVAKAQEEIANRQKDLEEQAEASSHKLEQLDALVEKRREEINSQLSEWQKQFSEAQERRASEYSEWRNAIEEKTATAINALIEKSREDLSAAATNFSQQIDGILGEAKEKHAAILSLYELTAGDSVAAGYLKNAEDEKEQANLWRWISIGFISATSLWLLFVWGYAAYVGAANIGWQQIVMSALLTGVLLYGAAYSSQQSTRHRNNEKRTRWFALEVKAIDPFISSLGEEERNQLKRLLSEKLFGQSGNLGSSESGVFDEHAYKMIIKGIAEILSKLPKTGG